MILFIVSGDLLIFVFVLFLLLLFAICFVCCCCCCYMLCVSDIFCCYLSVFASLFTLLSRCKTGFVVCVFMFWGLACWNPELLKVNFASLLVDILWHSISMFRMLVFVWIPNESCKYKLYFGNKRHFYKITFLKALILQRSSREQKPAKWRKTFQPPEIPTCR